MCEREENLKFLIKLCYEKYKEENILNMKYNVEDRGINDKTIYSMCYSKYLSVLEKYCGPDCFFISWPSANIKSFEETKNQIIEASMREPTIHKIGWYGNIYSPLRDVMEYKTRPLLKKIGDENPELFDIIHISPNRATGGINECSPNYLSLPDLMRYKYLIDIGGNGWSGRMKWLLFSKRPLLMVDRKYIEYFYNDLKPYVHYIPVKMDLSNLLEQAEWMRTHEEESQQIAENAYIYAMENFTIDKFVDRVYYVYKNIEKYQCNINGI